MATSSIPEGMNEKEYYETVVSEEEFLRWYKEQDHPTYENPSVTTDMVAYCFVEGRLKLLVIRRKTHPCQHRVALVGGFLQKHEDAIQACIREVQEEVGLELAGSSPSPTWSICLRRPSIWSELEMMPKKFSSSMWTSNKGNVP